MANTADVTEASFSFNVLNNEKTVLVDFWAPFCGLVGGRCRLVSHGQLQFMTAHSLPDATHAATELGWTPTSLDHGLTATIAYRNQSSAQPPYGRSSRHHHRSTSTPMA